LESTELIRNTGKKILLILSDRRKREKQMIESKNADVLVNGTVHFIPYWVLNHNLALFFKRDYNDTTSTRKKTILDKLSLSPAGGIYYNKGINDVPFNPVYIDYIDENKKFNYVIFFEIFFAYLMKADSANENNIVIIDSKNDLHKYISDFFDDIS